MFLRRIRPQGRGSKQTYWELVESYRTSKGSRLRRVCYLGKLSAKEVSGWEKLTRRLDGKVEPSPGLFDPPSTDDSDFQAVDVNGIRLRELKSFGQEYLAWTPRTLMEELRTIQSGEVMLPVRGTDGTAGETLVIRCVTQPDQHTKILLNRLGLALPNHLKRYRLATAEPAVVCAM